MMAPLPHDQQRPDEAGSGLTDLLGIAPGASYRLVVPATPDGAISGLDAAFLAAAQQTPRPDVITASLGFGTDQFGFSSRYLEDDPVTASVIASIVQLRHRGDRLRPATGCARAPTRRWPPSGGSTATNVAASAKAATASMTCSSPGRRRPTRTPARSTSAARRSTTSSPRRRITRRTRPWPPSTRSPRRGSPGAGTYASGFGSRVDVSAPGDSVAQLLARRSAGPRTPCPSAWRAAPRLRPRRPPPRRPCLAGRAADGEQGGRAVALVRPFVPGKTERRWDRCPRRTARSAWDPRSMSAARWRRCSRRRDKAAAPGVARVAVEQRQRVQRARRVDP